MILSRYNKIQVKKQRVK